MTTRVVVIGAGWSGLASAKTYMQLTSSKHNLYRHSIDLVILDEAESVGGVWSRDRLYPGLVANGPNGWYEYSDLSMVDDEHPILQSIPGHRVQEYLEAYARKFGLFDKIRFNSKVTSVQRTEGGWQIVLNTSKTLLCDKLIVATGLYSKPRVPDIPNAGYEGVVIHSKELGRRAVDITDNPDIKEVAVVGSAKSAIETASIFLAAGKKVHWVVRPSDHGVAVAVEDPDAKINLVAAATTRLFGAFAPSIWDTSGFWYLFLHSKKWYAVFGTILRWLFYAGMSWSLRHDFGYGRNENTKALDPEDYNLFYYTTNISPVLKQNEVLQALKENDMGSLKVHKASPVQLEARSIALETTNGSTSVRADAVVWCTGWDLSIDFFSDKDVEELGLPCRLTERSQKNHLVDWCTQQEAAMRDAERLFPGLQHPDGYAKSHWNRLPPFRLYRNVLPTPCLANGSNGNDNVDRSIAFTSFTSSGQTHVTVELCSLWAVAWMENLISERNVPTKPQAIAQIIKEHSWRLLRYGRRAAQEMAVVLEAQSFHDEFCRDLGLEPERKLKRVREECGRGVYSSIKGGLLEWLEPYRGVDYDGVIDEFLRTIFPSGEPRLEEP